MLSQHYLEMTNQKSAIRELFDYGRRKAAEIGYENVFDYSLGNPSVPAPKEFADACIELLTKEDPVKLHGYSPSLGIPSVREAVAKSLNDRFGVPFTMDDIFMTSAAAGAIAHAVRAVTVPGDEVLTFAPYFPEYQYYINETGATLRVVTANPADFQINFDAFREMLSPKTMAVLINTPNNPSGIVYSTATIKRLAEILTEKSKAFGHPIFLISDEPYREIVFEGTDAPFVASYYDYTIICYSFSKSVSLPGERIGYVAVHPNCPDAAKIVEMCGQISRGIGHNCPSSMIQLAVTKVLYLTADLSVYQTNKDILYRELTRIGYEIVEPGGAFYLFPKAPGGDAKAFCEAAKEENLLLVPSDSFGCPGHFRICYCIPTEKVERSIPVFASVYEHVMNR